MADDNRHLSTDPADTRPLDEPRLETPATGERRETAARLLRRTRELQGEDLGEIATALRIRHAYLSAIERGAFDELPGATYAVGFVRSYAAFLGLDADEVVRRFKADTAGLEQSQELHFPEPINEGKVPGGAVILIAMVLLVGAYGGWYVLSSPETSLSDMAPPVPERLQALVGGGSEGEPADGPPQAVASESGEAGGTQGASSEDTGSSSEPDGTGEPGGTAGATQTAAAPDTEGDTGSEPESDSTAPEPDATDAGAAAGDAGGAQTPDEPAATGDSASDAGTAAADADAPETAPGGDNGAETASDTGAETGGETVTVGEQTGDIADAEASGTGTADTATAEDADGPATTDADTADAASTAAGTDAIADAGSDTSETQQTPSGSASQPDDGGAPPVPGSDAESAGGEPGATQTASTDTGRSFGATTGEAALVLRATADSWVQVRGPGDDVLVSRVLEPGDVYRVPERDGLRLHTGNAGGLTVEVDGEAVRSLGDSGEVRRNVTLSPANLLDGG